MLGTIAADRAFLASYQGDMRQAVEFARQALEYLPDSDPLSLSMRCVANLILGESYWLIGSLEKPADLH